MSVNTFEYIRSILHFNDKSQMEWKDDLTRDKLFKIRPVISKLYSKFLSIPMEQNLSLDEQVCATKTKHSLWQYNSKKPNLINGVIKFMRYAIHKDLPINLKFILARVLYLTVSQI